MPWDGAYRISGSTGSPDSPTDVWVEVVTPMASANASRVRPWHRIAAVMRWTTQGWRVADIVATDAPSPAQDGPMPRMTTSEIAVVLQDVRGFVTFAQRR